MNYGGEGGIRTHVGRLCPHPISSRRRYDRFGTSPEVMAFSTHACDATARLRAAARYSSLRMAHRARAFKIASGGPRLRPAGHLRSAPPSTLEQILALGELRVVTRNSPTSYYLGADGAEGPEYDLVRRFAADLGVGAATSTRCRALPTSRAAVDQRSTRTSPPPASRSATPGGEGVTFGPPYQHVRQHLIYRAGRAKPRCAQGRERQARLG